MKLITKANSVFDRILNIAAALAAAILLFITLSVCAEITARNLFSYSIRWVLEISEVSLLFITFLGAAWLLRREGHVSLDLLVPRLKAKAQIIINVTMSIIGASACLIATWYGVKLTWEDFHTGYNFGGEMMLTKWPIEIIIPIGSFLLFVQFLRRTSSFLSKSKISKESTNKSQIMDNC